MQGMRVFLFDHGGDTRTERRHPPGGVDLRPKEQRAPDVGLTRL